VLAVVVLAALIIPGRLLAVEHESDDDLVPYAASGTSGHAVPDQRWNADTGVVAKDRERIQLVEVRPRITSDTAAADVAFEVCTPKPSGGVGVTLGSLTSSCSRVVDVAGAWTRLRPGVGQLVVSVTPRRAGVVKIDGFDVTYVDHGRRATEHAGFTLRLHAP
jgi:hypothetical protein